MTEPQTKQTTTVEPSGTVTIDYRGTVGAAEGQPAIMHTLSPLFAMWPVNGAANFHLMPGVNRVDAKLWTFYSRDAGKEQGLEGGHPQIKQMIDAGYIKKLSAPPDDVWNLFELIGRSIDIDGLRWIGEQEKARSEPRVSVLDAVEAALAVAHPVKVKPGRFRERTLNVSKRDRQGEPPSLAMG